MKTLVANPVECLLHWAAARPQRDFLVQPDLGRRWTWAAAADEVARMAAALRALALPAGSRIAITGRNTAHWVMADLAIEMAGHVSVGLYPKQATETVRYILEHSEAKAVFVGPMPEPEPVLAGIPAGVARIRLPYPEVAAEALDWDALVASTAAMTDYRPAPPEALRTLVYTSGTTGHPKGVMVSFGAGRWCGQDALEVLPLREDEVFFSYMPLAHIFERTSVEGNALGGGGSIHFLDALEHFPQRLRETRPTRFCAVPLIWSRLQAGVLAKLPAGAEVAQLPESLRAGIVAGLGLDRCYFPVSGAAPLAPALIRWFAALGLPVFQGYGMTENLAYVSCNLPGANREGSVGRPFPGVDVRIGAQGEIQTRHPGQMSGYYREPAKTAEALDAEGWLHTGDMGALDAEGYLYVTGRIKDQFKTAKGHFVTPVPMENRLLENPHISQCCVIGSGLKAAVAAVVLAPAAQAGGSAAVEHSLAATLAALNESLGPQEQVEATLLLREAWTIDNGLLTPTLKIKRAEIEARYTAAAAEALTQRKPFTWI